MRRTACVLVCVCASWTLAAVMKNTKAYTYETLGYDEGDVCKEEGGALWTCKKFLECPKAKEAFDFNKTRPIVCSYKKKTLDAFIVCCDSGVKTRPTRSKSKEMCEEYAKAVQVKKPGGGFFDDEDVYEDTCVASEPLIAFGKESEPREFPHMALIGVGKKGAIFWACGGTLISERFVLSAAHCTSFGYRGDAEWVRLGEYNIESTSDDSDGKALPEDYRIIQAIVHPGWKPPSLYDDICLFKLERDATFNEFVRPACLHARHSFPKATALATGWGKTDVTASYGVGSAILMKVNLTVFERETCTSNYAAAIGSTKLKEGIRDRSQLCAGDVITMKDVCQGDSGGPLQLRLKEPYCMYSVIGVVSFGPTDCGNGGAPSVFSRVSHFLPWIESKVWP